jgi:hypothetical protein
LELWTLFTDEELGLKVTQPVKGGTGATSGGRRNEQGVKWRNPAV